MDIPSNVELLTSAVRGEEVEDMEVDDDAEMLFASVPSTVHRVRSFPKFVPMENLYTSDFYYVRDCYVEYYELVLKMLKDKHAVALTGTPGIGKSVFMAYFFEEYSDRHPEAYVTLASHNKESQLTAVVITQGKRVIKRELGKLRKTLVKHVPPAGVETNDLWLLDGPPDDVHQYFRWVSFSSPKESWLKKLDKNEEACSKVFMPTWTLEELCDAAAHLRRTTLLSAISDNQLRKLDLAPESQPAPRRAMIDYCFAAFGGVPRTWFARGEIGEALHSLRTAANSLSSDHIMKALMGEDVPQQVYRLLHFVPGESPHETATIQVGSAMIKRFLVDRENDIMDSNQVRLENMLRATPAGKSLLGFFVETRTYRLLSSGCTINARKLDEEVKKNSQRKRPVAGNAIDTINRDEEVKKRSLVITIPEAAAIGRITNSFDIQKFDPTVPHVVKPASKNLESIDGFYWNADGFVALFQVTVSVEHPVKARGLSKVLKALKVWEAVKISPETTVALVFIVPQANTAIFRKQKIATGPLLDDASSVTAIDGIAGATANKLAACGIRTVGDLRAIKTSKDLKATPAGRDKESAWRVVSSAQSKLVDHEVGGYSGGEVEQFLQTIPQYVRGI